MNVHILTPCARPDNIAKVAASIETARAGVDCQLTWRIEYDRLYESVGGYSIRNRMIDQTGDPDTWLWMLDDDTLAHPGLLQCLADHQGFDAVVVGQSRPDRWGAKGGCADPGRLYNGAHGFVDDGCAFDIGQAVVRRHVFGDYRYRLERPGDGWFWEDILSKTGNVAYVDEILSFYNALA